MDKNITPEPFPWKNEYSLNVSIYDEQHKKFLEIINLLKRVIYEGPKNESISEVFYSLAHFVEHYHIQEEIYLKDMKYEHLARHKELHQDFIDHIVQFQKDFETGKVKICRDMYNYLEDWFDHHMMKVDKEAVASISRGRGSA